MSFINCDFNMNFDIGHIFDHFGRKNIGSKSKKSARTYEPFTAPNGLTIEGPLADHLRSMNNIAEAFEPGIVARKSAADALAEQNIQVSVQLSEAEKEALLNINNPSGNRESAEAGTGSGSEPASDGTGQKSGGENSKKTNPENTENIITAVTQVVDELNAEKKDQEGQPANPNPARPDAGKILHPTARTGSSSGNNQSRRKRRAPAKVPA